MIKFTIFFKMMPITDKLTNMQFSPIKYFYVS